MQISSKFNREKHEDEEKATRKSVTKTSFTIFKLELENTWKELIAQLQFLVPHDALILLLNAKRFSFSLLLGLVTKMSAVLKCRKSPFAFGACRKGGKRIEAAEKYLCARANSCCAMNVFLRREVAGKCKFWMSKIWRWAGEVGACLIDVSLVTNWGRNWGSFRLQCEEVWKHWR
jgi:hypothetical protein